MTTYWIWRKYRNGRLGEKVGKQTLTGLSYHQRKSVMGMPTIENALGLKDAKLALDTEKITRTNLTPQIKFIYILKLKKE